jgi:hypothetical protein
MFLLCDFCIQVAVSGLLVVSSLAKEVALLSELLAPIATPKLAATFKKALLDLFHAATQVGVMRCDEV